MTEPADKPKGESQIWGVSLRGWMAVMIVAAICSIALLGRQIDPALLALGSTVIGAYFGQRQHPKSS